jgi:hypothetical protein
MVWYYINNIYEKLDSNIDIASNNNKKINKIAICFFGICRSTPHTIESIKNNIYNQFDDKIKIMMEKKEEIQKERRDLEEKISFFQDEKNKLNKEAMEEMNKKINEEIQQIHKDYE